MTREELIEAIKDRTRSAFIYGESIFESTIDAVLEEAANVADSCNACDAASAIRALKGE